VYLHRGAYVADGGRDRVWPRRATVERSLGDVVRPRQQQPYLLVLRADASSRRIRVHGRRWW
jgi:hypothetical protein